MIVSGDICCSKLKVRAIVTAFFGFMNKLFSNIDKSF